MTHLLLAAAVLTMRVDYYHTGNAAQEHFSLDRVVVEPLPAPWRKDDFENRQKEVQERRQALQETLDLYAKR